MAQTKVDEKIQNQDVDSPADSGDFRLNEITLHSPSNDGVLVLNTPSVFLELNIYEDLFSNVLKGTFTFLDTQGFAESTPLIGDETLIVSFTTPGGEGSQVDVTSAESELESQTVSEEAVRQRFKVYDCVEVGLQDRSKAFQLLFVSEEYIFSSKMKVSKGYVGKKYSFAVKDVMNKINEKLRGDLKKKIYVEETATPQNFIFPNWSPFQAINFCASRSLSEDIKSQDQEGSIPNSTGKPVGSLFVFYEKLGTGFFYESIESMILKQKSQKNLPVFKYQVKRAEGMTESSGFIAHLYSAVDSFQIKSSFKTLDGLQNGLFGSKLIAYDPIRMKFDEVKFDYYEKKDTTTQRTNDQTGVTEETTDPENKDDSPRRFANFIATDLHRVSENVGEQNKIISTNSDFVGSNEASIKLATTTREHDAMFVPPSDNQTSIGVTTKTFSDLTAKPNNVEDWLLQRQAQIREFGSIVVSCTVSGNSSRHVGDLIRFEIPSTIPEDDPEFQKTTIGHQLYGGFYIISKIRHIITKEGYDMDVELIKNSFASRIPGQILENPTS